MSRRLTKTNFQCLQTLEEGEHNERHIAVGRRNWTFAGSDRGGERAAAIYTLIETAKLNDIDPQAWLADMLARLPTIPPSGSTTSCPGTGRPLAPPLLSLRALTGGLIFLP